MKAGKKKLVRLLNLVLVGLFACIVIGGISIGLAYPYTDAYSDPYTNPNPTSKPNPIPADPTPGIRPPTPDDEPEVEVTVGDDAVSVEVDGDNATVTIDSDTLDKALDDAIEQIEEQADEGVDSAVVTLPCDDESLGEASELNVEIDAGLAQKAAENNVSLKVESSDVDMTIPPSVLDTSALESVDEDSVISVGIKAVDEQTADGAVFKLEDEQGEPLGLAFEFDIVVSNTDGSQVEIDEFDSPVTIIIQLTPEDIEGIDNLDGLKMAWYNPETGETEVMASTLNSDTLELKFSTTHFSMYILVEMTKIKEEESADVQEEESADASAASARDAVENADEAAAEDVEPAAAASNESNTVQPAGNWWIWLVAAILVAAVATAAIITIKRKRA